MDPRITVSRQSIRQRPSMRALSGGGYEMGGIPTNYAEMAYGKGQHTSPQFSDIGRERQAVQPLNTSALDRNAEAMDAHVVRQIEAEEQDDRLAATEDSNSMRFRPFDRSFRERAGQLQWGQSPWRNFFQSMVDRGVDSMRSGAAAGWESPGHFDTQAPSMAGLYDAAQQGRANQLDADDMNRFTANYQRGRRG